MIHHLNTKKANGPENIAVKYYKLANEYICSFLSTIFNTCALQGIFPHELKLAEIIPIHKGGCDSSPNNYRPISLLSPLAKVFQSLILTRMSKFIAENKILCKEQFGFRKLHFTNHVLSDIFSFINNNRGNRHFTCIIFLDLKKAFNPVDHQMLLSKLEKLGFWGNFYNLLKDYLNNRKQYVNVNNVGYLHIC